MVVTGACVLLIFRFWQQCSDRQPGSQGGLCLRGYCINLNTQQERGSALVAAKRSDAGSCPNDIRKDCNNIILRPYSHWNNDLLVWRSYSVPLRSRAPVGKTKTLIYFTFFVP